MDHTHDDCDWSVDEGFDNDGDGWTTCGGDCDDDNLLAYPGHDEEYCNGFDDDCDGTVDEGCPGQEPSGDCCEAHGGIGCEDGDTEACVCAMDPFCCENTWDPICADEAKTDCGACGGELPTGDCCEVNGSPGCDDPGTEGCVCAMDPFCCENTWDQICADEAANQCGGCGLAQGDCCVPADTPGCGDADLEACVCGQDGFCCETAWDDLCVNQAADPCGGCGAGML